MSRTVALDIHKRFAEVAVHEHGRVRRLGRVDVDDLESFAASLLADDHVVIESTSQTWAVVELIGRHVQRVTISNPMRTRAIASAKVKTDKVDARVLAQLGAADFLPPVWRPDADTQELRRRVAHRAGLVRQRTRLRNQVHAVLARNLVTLNVSDAFGCKGRRALAEVVLPDHEREQLDSALRLHDAIDGEIRLAERTLAERALADRDVRLLMSIPGVGPMTSLSIVSVIGDVARFPSSRELVSYFGLDPRVRQSGDRPARHGHISRAGQAHARGLLVEAAHSAVRSPGPLRAFYQRIRARRGTKIAICATARKLLAICWQLLSKHEPYRYEAPSQTRRKTRLLQRAAGRSDLVSIAGEREARALERRVLRNVQSHYEAHVAQRIASASEAETRSVGP